MNVNPVLAFSAFCGFSFAEDNQRVQIQIRPSMSQGWSRSFLTCGSLLPRSGILKQSLKLRIWMSASSCKPWLLTTELEQYFPVRNVIFVSLVVHWSLELTQTYIFGARAPLSSQTMHKDLTIFFLWDFFTDYFNFLQLNVDLGNCTCFPGEQMWYVYICS